MKKQITRKYNTGFTLVETLVSLALFSVVLVISSGVIFSVINVNKKNQAISSVVNNLNYSIDSMVRDIKTGYLYKCNYAGVTTVDGLKASTERGECDNGDNVTLVSTITGSDLVVKYQLQKKPSDINWYIEKTIYSTTTGASVYSITDKIGVNIEDLNFTVRNPYSLDTENVVHGQPSVFVTIRGVAGSQDIDTSKFFLQTFISQRLINLTDFKD